MGCLDSLFGNPVIKNKLKGRNEEQQQTILYFEGGTGGCLGSKPCTDAEYDSLVRAKLTTVATRDQALDKLGIDIDDVSEIDPVRLEGWYYGGKDGYAKRGEDNVLRSSGYQITWLFFSSEQVYAYQYVFTMADDKKTVLSDEYFYRDITNFSTTTRTIEYTRNIPGGCLGGVKTERSTEDVDVFRLVVPGEKFECSMTQSEYTQKAIRAMQQKLREKKTTM